MPHNGCQCRIRIPHGTEASVAFSDLLGDGLEQVHLAPYFPSKPTVTGRMLLKAKDQKLTAYRRLVGRELSAALKRKYDGEANQPVLSYVPRLPSKVRINGTDQAGELAKGIGEEMGLTVTPLLSRHGGGDQKMKSAAQRFQTSDGRYRLLGKTRAAVKGKDVWLCDDVITSGASMLACASLLMEAGARKVVAVSVAYTAREPEQEEKDEKENGD